MKVLGTSRSELVVGHVGVPPLLGSASYTSLFPATRLRLVTVLAQLVLSSSKQINNNNNIEAGDAAKQLLSYFSESLSPASNSAILILTTTGLLQSCSDQNQFKVRVG